MPLSHWNSVRLLNLPRVTIALFLLAIASMSQWLNVPVIESLSHPILVLLALVYLVSAMGLQALLRMRKPPLSLMVIAGPCLDVVALTLAIFLSSGLESGFGVLLFLMVAGGCCTLPNMRLAIFYAAVASMAVVAGELAIRFVMHMDRTNITHAGLLGFSFFIAAIVGQALMQRLHRARTHEEDVHYLSAVNRFIMEQTKSGMLVIDETQCIRFYNHAARRFLGVESLGSNMPLANCSTQLLNALDEWQQSTGLSRYLHIAVIRDVELQLSFLAVESHGKHGVLILLEEVAGLRQRAQQLKMAALGGLAASIAHEVRNPLGVIAHAVQLLSESPTLSENERGLTKIMLQNSTRVSAIIDNVQTLSRSQPFAPERLCLVTWMRQFFGEFCRAHKLPREHCRLDCAEKTIPLHIDPTQLHQVLWNLTENALRYSTGSPLVILRVGRTTEGRPYLEVEDTGPGIDPKKVSSIFLPFYTSEKSGSGLGLYLAQELCQANQARLFLKENSNMGCCFRIDFSMPITSEA